MNTTQMNAIQYYGGRRGVQSISRTPRKMEEDRGREGEGAIQRQHRLQQMGLGVMLRQADGHRERQSRRGDSGYVSELSYDGRYEKQSGIARIVPSVSEERSLWRGKTQKPGGKQEDGDSVVGPSGVDAGLDGMGATEKIRQRG